MRSGNVVQLRFSVSARTTDGLPLRDATVHGALCRQVAKAGPCTPVPLGESSAALRVPQGGAGSNPVTWTDTLPADLASGPARVLAYRVELRNAAGRSAGYSDPVYAAAGETPSQVEGFKGNGTRLGVLLQWAAVAGPGDLLLQREDLAVSNRPRTEPVDKAEKANVAAAITGRARPRPDATPSTVWLQPERQDAGATEILDSSIQEGIPYRYTAVRRLTAQIGGRTLELRSAPSVPVEITWRDVYPPSAPQQLTAIGFRTPAASPAGGSNSGAQETYAVDLIWQPVNDPRVTGYVVTRQAVDAAGQAQGAAERLSSPAVTTPSFHDSAAHPAKAYRYEVTAVDAKGNTSAPAEAIVPPAAH